MLTTTMTRMAYTIRRYQPSPFIIQEEAEQLIEYRKKYLSPSYKTFEAFDDPLIIVKGDGCMVEDIYGKRYIDMMSNNLSTSVGHSHPQVHWEVSEQSRLIPHCPTMYYNREVIMLAKELLEKVPPHPSGEDMVCHFLNSGSEAVDLAIQYARVFTRQKQIISLHDAYHGTHGAALDATAILKFHLGILTHQTYLQANDIEQLKTWLYLHAKTRGIAGMIMESVQGYGGVRPLDPGYMKEGFQMVEEAGGVSIVDEIQTGFGRLGESYWGFQLATNDYVPDIFVAAKGLGNGHPISVVVARKDIAEAFASKVFFNTYASNPMMCAAARATIRVIDSERLMDNAKNIGEFFMEGFNQLQRDYPLIIKERRGMGLLQGLEINGATPELSTIHAKEIQKRCLAKGVLLGRGSHLGNVIRIQPPFCISQDIADDVIRIITGIVEDYTKEIESHS